MAYPVILVQKGRKKGMTDYTKLVKALRCCAENFGCPIECPRYSPADEGVRACVSRLEKDAAAAIEALQAELDKYHELCDVDEIPEVLEILMTV